MANDYNVNGNVNKGSNGTLPATSSDTRIAEHEHELKLARIESTGKVEAEQARTAGKIAVLEKEHMLRAVRNDQEVELAMKMVITISERADALTARAIEAQASTTKARGELVLTLAGVDKELAMAFLVEDAAGRKAGAEALTLIAKAMADGVGILAKAAGAAIESDVAAKRAFRAKADKLS